MRISKCRHVAAAISSAAAACFFATHAFGQLVAFPGAEGFGALTTGGRSGSIYVVTNLNDSGAGSFRDAVSQSNRIIVFAVSGYVDLLSAVSCSSNLTILGQTAPGQGIAFMGHEVSFSDTSNQFVQYIRAREGSTDTSAKASINLGDVNGGILDHVSAEFSQYDNIDAVGANSAADNITIQNSLIADGIKAQQFNIHTEGNQTTYINNVFANSEGRSVLAKSNTQFVDNAIYDYGYAYTTGNSAGKFSYDIINNYFVAGPSTNTASDAFYQLDSNQSAYSSGNLLDGNKDGVLNGSAVTPGGLNTLTSEYSPLTQYLPIQSSATAAWNFDIAHAGDMYPNGDGTFGRDQVDAQIISQVQSAGTSGQIYNEQDDDGLSNDGFGTIPTATLSTSNTLDTVPFSWLTTHGLSTTNASMLTLHNALGYDMIEQYAQQIQDQYASQTATNGDWTTATWSSQTPGLYDHALIRGTGAANGLVTINNDDSAQAFSVSIGGNGPAAGETLNMSGGSLTIQDTIYVGDQNNATFTLTGGTVHCDNVQLGNTVYDTNGNPTNYNGTLNLNGGTLMTGQVVLGAGSPGSYTSGGTWNWNGGTLQAGPYGLNVTAPATIGANGAILDTNGQSASMSGVLSGPGTLTKIGVGVATMTRTDSYGSTIINAGSLKAHVNGSFGTGTVTINDADGMQIQTGVTIANQILDNAGANEAIDVPDSSASATVSGPITLVSQSADQYRMGVSGTNSTLTLTGASTVGSAVALITRGNIIFAKTGSLNVVADGLEIGRFSSTSTLNFTIQDNASVSAISLALGGLNGSSDDLTTVVTVTGSALFSAGVGALNLDNSATAGNTTTLTLSGNSITSAGIISETSTASGHAATLDLNGGTLMATAGGTFFPVLNAAAVNVQTGGAIFNNGGFGITIAQPLLGSANDGGFTANGAGTITLNGANTYNGATNITQGTLLIGSSSALPSGNNVTDNASFVLAAGTTAGNVSGSGQTTVNPGVNFTANNFVQSALINSGTTRINGAGTVGPISGTGTLIIGTGTSNNTLQLSTSSGLSQQNSLTIESGSKLDITNNHLLIADPGGVPDDSMMTTLLGYVTSRAIISTAGLSGYGIGVVDGNDDVLGTAVPSGQIEVAYALQGDANLDGKVDITDFNIFAPNFGFPTTLGWEAGDFNYSGAVDITDFNLFAANFGMTATGVDLSIPSSDRAALAAFVTANGLLTNIPEPHSAALAALTIAGLMRRRRKPFAPPVFS